MKIVVLDDSPTVLLTIQSLLEDMGVSEDEIHLFKNGKEALDYIEKSGADIIFSDVQMPGISGYEFVERLLEISNRFVPTLFIVSASERHDSVAKMKQIGAKRFIRKPISSHHFHHFVAPEIAKIREKGSSNGAVGQVHSEGDSVQLNGKKGLILDLDHEVLARKIGINVKYVPRLVESFFNEANSVIKGLEEAVETKQFSQISHYAHSLKGSAGNMKFDELYEMAKAMENAALSEDNAFAYFEHCQMIKEAVVPSGMAR